MKVDDYMGPKPTIFFRGFSDRGRFGIRGEGTDIPDTEENRDVYEAGVKEAQAERLISPPTPWVK